MSSGDFDNAEINDVDETNTPENDNAVLAALLGTEERALIAAIGGPWYQLNTEDVEMVTVPECELAFIGRTGPSALLAFAAHPTEVLVGRAVGTWSTPGTIEWGRQAPHASVPTGDAWLERLATAIDAAYNANKVLLVNCRYCGEVTGPEFALGDDCCSGCASTYFGVVF